MHSTHFRYRSEGEPILRFLKEAQKDGWEELSLRDSHLKDIPIIVFALRNLIKLDLSHNNISQISSDIARLPNLSSLNLSENYFLNVPPEIGQLRNLRTLNLSRCQLKQIPKSIFLLENLEVLILDNNQISQIPSDLGNLKHLRVLSIRTNYLSELPPEIGQLHQLRFLKLEGNSLTSLPKEMRHLNSLAKLNLSRNKFTRFPKILRQLKNLKLLKITHVRFRGLPAKIENLQKLKILNLNFSGLMEVSPTIAKISTLEGLFLLGNSLKSVPIEFKELGQLKRLDLRHNATLPIPPEILSKWNDPQIILDYISSSFKTIKHRLNEVKLLFVGQGSIGKTSLVNRITQNIFTPNQVKTEGISISKLKIFYRQGIGFQSNDVVKDQTENQQSLINVNIWDFGGQEIMHATHQFFLTKRSLYLLVLDSRLTQEENRVEYWLKIIQSFSDESPVLIVGNKIDQHPLDIDRTGLQNKYPNIVGILETSAATGAGIEELKATIAKQVNKLPHVRDLLPKTWFTVKTKLEGLGRESNFITHDKYLELCAENEVSDEASQRTLIGFLHDLGVVLYFQEDRRLSDLGILNPQWVTNGVYKILNSHTLFQNKGVLTTNMLDEVLNLPEYPRGNRLFIVDMMKKFELCYDIEADKTFLVPDLLPKDEPADLKFNGIPAFEYAYPVLPSSVITRFIVRMNQKIHDSSVWRTGVLLKIGDNIALVKADIEDRKISIAIDGLEHTRRDSLSAIRYQLDEIHNSIKGLNAEKYVPVPNLPNSDAVEYETLLMLERDGDEIIKIRDGKRMVPINIRELLSGIESDEKVKARGGINIFIGRDLTGNLVIGDDNDVQN